MPPPGTISGWCIIDPGTVLTNLLLTERVTLVLTRVCSVLLGLQRLSVAQQLFASMFVEKSERVIFLAQRTRVEPLEAPHILQDRLTVLPTVV